MTAMECPKCASPRVKHLFGFIWVCLECAWHYRMAQPTEGGEGIAERFYVRDGRVWVQGDGGYEWVIEPTTVITEVVRDDRSWWGACGHVEG